MPNPGFANSGIQIRSWEGPRKWQVSGYQPDMDCDDQYTGTCYGENYRGGLAGRGQKTLIGTDHQPKIVEQFADQRANLPSSSRSTVGTNTTSSPKATTSREGQRTLDVRVDRRGHRGPQGRHHRLADSCRAADEGRSSATCVSSCCGQPGHGGAAEAEKKIVFIAGHPSHGYAEHEHHAGCLLLAKMPEREHAQR